MSSNEIRRAPIFIGGTGRCGTTLLSQLLNRHRDIYSLPWEARFLVDPDGLINLTDALTVRYSPTQAREALYKFERLLTVYLTTPHKAPYRGFDFTRFVDADYFVQRTAKYFDELADGEFEGEDMPRKPERRSRRSLRNALALTGMGRPDSSRSKLRIVRYQPDRAALLKVTAKFVDDLFKNAAGKNGKTVWCEKTPTNFLHFDFLRELFPEAALLHIMRDPRGVVHSMCAMAWAPSETTAVCDYLKSAYEKWFVSSAEMQTNGNRCLEVRLEDLAEDPSRTLKLLCDFCGVQGTLDNAHFKDVDPARVNAWRNSMSPQDQKIVVDKLGTVFEKLGYSV